MITPTYVTGKRYTPVMNAAEDDFDEMRAALKEMIKEKSGCTKSSRCAMTVMMHGLRLSGPRQRRIPLGS